MDSQNCESEPQILRCSQVANCHGCVVSTRSVVAEISLDSFVLWGAEDSPKDHME